jgi:hypothetical protein
VFSFLALVGDEARGGAISLLVLTPTSGGKQYFRRPLRRFLDLMKRKEVTFLFRRRFPSLIFCFVDKDLIPERKRKFSHT